MPPDFDGLNSCLLLDADCSQVCSGLGNDLVPCGLSDVLTVLVVYESGSVSEIPGFFVGDLPVVGVEVAFHLGERVDGEVNRTNAAKEDTINSEWPFVVAILVLAGALEKNHGMVVCLLLSPTLLCTPVTGYVVAVAFGHCNRVVRN